MTWDGSSTVFIALAFLCSFGVAQVTNIDDVAMTTTTTTEEMPLLDLTYETSHDAVITNCPFDQISFEVMTGYVYAAPSDILDSMPSILMMTECLDLCRSQSVCLAANYETGLCVLFNSNADQHPRALTESQFPVFTMYLQKTCLRNLRNSGRSWSFELVRDHALAGYEREEHVVNSRQECQQLCVDETEFTCRSANYVKSSGTCFTSEMDRHTTAGIKGVFQNVSGIEYLESNYVDYPVRLCEFQKMHGRILKTVDAVHQNVSSAEDCENLCLTSTFRCHSFDYGDTADGVCRLSHHAAATLSHIKEPYLEIPGVSTFELASCYDVTIDCRSGDMVARIKTSRVFSGKIYSKGSPNTCVTDVSNTLEFDLTLPYGDVACNVQRLSASEYRNDVVIQHHDMIVTDADLGLSVRCQYDLSNKSVSNEVGLDVKGDIEPSLEETQVVDSPNVIMRITDKGGDDVDQASVGDMLQMRFEIMDLESPYEIFVRDLVALDGSDEKQIILLDERGCPTEVAIMGPLEKIDYTGKNLAAHLNAFKFPTSEQVQFRALVTPCIPKCEPVVCSVMDFGGKMTEKMSYGRRKRSLEPLFHNYSTESDMIQETVFVDTNHVDVYVHPETFPLTNVRRSRREAAIPDEMLVEQSIRISDKFGFRGGKRGKKGQSKSNSSGDQSDEYLSEDEMVFSKDMSGICINTTGLIFACSIFLVIQVVLILVWTAIWQRRRHNKLEEPLSHTTTTESLRQLYDSGYPRRI